MDLETHAGAWAISGAAPSLGAAAPLPLARRRAERTHAHIEHAPTPAPPPKQAEEGEEGEDEEEEEEDGLAVIAVRAQPFVGCWLCLCARVLGLPAAVSVCVARSHTHT